MRRCDRMETRQARTGSRASASYVDGDPETLLGALLAAVRDAEQGKRHRIAVPTAFAGAAPFHASAPEFRALLAGRLSTIGPLTELIGRSAASIGA